MRVEENDPMAGTVTFVSGQCADYEDLSEDMEHQVGNQVVITEVDEVVDPVNDISGLSDSPDLPTVAPPKK
jgi:hypothetical protein